MAEIKTVSRKQIKKDGFPKPVNLSAELVNSLPEEQKKILFLLADLAGEEGELVKKINALKPSHPDGVVAIGGGVAPCEDEDDWMVITMDLREKRTRVREDIKAGLSEALDVGLGHLGIIQRQCANYGVKP